MINERTITLARTFGNGQSESFAYQAAKLSSGWDVGTPDVENEDLLEATAQTLATLLPQLPACRRQQLVVEAGTVNDYTATELITRSYLLAQWNDIILGIAEPGSNISANRWKGTIEIPDVNPHTPVCLAPSAVLALIRYFQEFQSLNILKPPNTLLICDTSSSLYPPQNLPIDKTSGDDHNFVFQLLARAESWFRPLSSVYGSDRRNLDIGISCGAEWPENALILETLSSIDSPHTGKLNWTAHYSVGTEENRLTCGEAPLDFRCSLRRLMNSLEGALSPKRIACDMDCIEGPQYGLSSWLRTDLQAGDILS